MPKEIDPKDTTRAAAYALWMKAPNPMVTFFKTFDVTNRKGGGNPSAFLLIYGYVF